VERNWKRKAADSGPHLIWLRVMTADDNEHGNSMLLGLSSTITLNSTYQLMDYKQTPKKHLRPAANTQNSDLDGKTVDFLAVTAV
jgi:hypothetical protein